MHASGRRKRKEQVVGRAGISYMKKFSAAISGPPHTFSHTCIHIYTYFSMHPSGRRERKEQDFGSVGISTPRIEKSRRCDRTLV
jgi:hypothetical protein